MASSYQSIPDFYVDQTIFITGVTGFLGKVLLEKLLRSCPGIRHIYLMMRPKRGQAIRGRLEEIVSSQLFDRLRSEQDDSFKKKLTVISGDLMEDELGISPEDRAVLESEVTIVFHSAASVRFDDPLKTSVQLNLMGVKMMMELARKMTNLKIFLHVSTAYSNCELDKIDEVIYPPSIHPQKVMDAMEWMDESIIDQVTPSILGGKPNTYTFNKQMAEYLITDTYPDIPVVIIRPSIVCGSWAEPVEGWVDNFNGASGAMASIGKGLLRSMPGNPDYTADIIPVDIVVNTMIASVWANCGMKGSPTPPIYNCTSGQINGIEWHKFQAYGSAQCVKYPADGCLRYPYAKFTRSITMHKLKWIFNHQLPAALLDLWLYISGRTGIFVRVMDRLNRSLNVLNYFTTHEWVFSNDNVFRLMDKMSSADKMEFNFDVRKINWELYMEHYWQGIKRFALKDDMSEMENARAHLKKLQRLGFLFNTIIVVILWRILVKRSKVAHNVWQLMLNLSAKLVQTIPTIARS